MMISKKTELSSDGAVYCHTLTEDTCTEIERASPKLALLGLLQPLACADMMIETGSVSLTGQVGALRTALSSTYQVTLPGTHSKPYLWNCVGSKAAGMRISGRLFWWLRCVSSHQWRVK